LIPNPGRTLVLDEVAKRARTTPQTVLRHFGSRAGLLEAAARRGLASVKAEREAVPKGDIPAIAAYLARHYEEHGPMMLRMLAVEAEVPGIARIIDRGRELHRSWVGRVLEPQLASLAGAERSRRLALLVAITDLLAWKVLRLEQRLSQSGYRRCVSELLRAIR
jgi:AcrR family transcriptional regulator